MASISDFFGAYPYPVDPLFNTEIARKAEFAELTLESRESLLVKRGGAYKHQKLVVRYLTWYDRLLLIHEPGTGKSCIIVHSAELFKREFEKNDQDPTKIRRAVILISGDTLKENIRNEIVCKCTDRIYETKEVLTADSETGMKNNLTRVIKKWYDIMTYQDLANEIRKKQTEQALEEYMSNKVFYVDEAHNLPTLKDIARRRVPPTTIRQAKELARVHEAAHAKKPARSGKERKSPRVFGESVYETIFRAFHKGQRNKIILATATPMINSSSGIVPLMNLILPLDESEFPGPMPRLTEEDLNQREPEFFEPFFRSRVSYVRSLETGVIPSPQGIPLSEEEEPGPEGYRLGQTIVYEANMSLFQYTAYRQAYNRRETRQQQEGTIDDKQLDAFYGDEKHASLFVYPDGSYGNAGFTKYLEVVDNKYRIKQNADGRILAANIANPDILPTLSAKYSEIIELCRSSYPQSELEYDVDHGIVFVYFADFNVGSGAGIFTLCLKAHGYREFDAASDVFTSAQHSSRGIGPCPSTGENLEERGLSIEKAKRFIFLTSKTSRAQIYNFFKVLNSYENRYGEYVQVVVASKRAREGININNAVKQIMASGSWNYSRNYQARERVFRSTSHDVRLDEERQKLIQQGRDPAEAVIPLKTYNMVSVYPGLSEDEVEQLEQQTGQPVSDELREPFFHTVDTRIYYLVERKDIPVRRIMRFAKQGAFDCFLNRARNIRPTDQGHDFEPICDYGPCEYNCFGIDPNWDGQLDYTTKILYYSSEEIKAAEQEIQNLFSRFYSLKIDQIKQLMPDIRSIYVDMALNNLIRNNERILNRLGFPGYLREGPNGIIYLEKDQFEIRSHPENTAYTSALIGTQDPRNNVFADFVANVQYDQEQDEVVRLQRLDPGSFEFNDLLAKLSLISKVNLLELVTERRARTGQTNNFINAIVRTFNHAIFTYPEPVDAIRQVEYDVANRNKGRGRKPKPESKMKRIAMSEDARSLQRADPNRPTEKVIFHTLLQQGNHSTTKYGRISQHQKAEGPIRILKLSEGVGWREVNEIEYIVYNDIIRSDISNHQNYYEQFPFYGIRLAGDKSMSIRDRRNEDPEQSAKDLRTRRSGKNCISFKKPELINFLYEMKVSANVQVPLNLTRPDMITFIQQQSRRRGGAKEQIDLGALMSYPDDQLLHLYSWYLRGDSKKELCTHIEQRFIDTGRLYTGRMSQSQQQRQQQQNQPEVGSIRTGGDATIVEYLPQTESGVTIEPSDQPLVETEIDLSDDPTERELTIELPGQIPSGQL